MGQARTAIRPNTAKWIVPPSEVTGAATADVAKRGVQGRGSKDRGRHRVTFQYESPGSIAVSVREAHRTVDIYQYILTRVRRPWHIAANGT